MSDINQAVSELEQGDWRAAHRIVQPLDSPMACWAHGIVHLMEGDEFNARYWHRRANRPLPAPGENRIEREIEALRDRLD
jgi:hypothetical protein